MRKHPSISDIAKKLNISVTTVSFVLNGKGEENRISKSLTEKVIRVANEVGYVANHLARSLRTGKTHILGLLVEDISNPFFANVAGEIEQIANDKGYRIFYCSSKNDTVKTKELIRVFEERQVDGYIITPVPGIEKKIATLLEENNKLVLLDRYFPEINANYVVVSNEQGAYDATNHLIKQGYKNVAFITTDSEQTQMLGRQKGYLRALSEQKLNPSIKKIHLTGDTETIIGKISTFLKREKKLDAVFFATNYLGVWGLEAIRRLGLHIPFQLAVVSFDDHDLFRLYQPSITVVSQPIKQISEKVITVLLGLLESDDPAEPQHITIPTELIIRESSTPKTSQ